MVALVDAGYKDPEEQCAENEARESRGHWKHPLDFLFSCISVSVGLGSKYLFIPFKSSIKPTAHIYMGDLEQCSFTFLWKYVINC